MVKKQNMRFKNLVLIRIKPKKVRTDIFQVLTKENGPYTYGQLEVLVYTSCAKSKYEKIRIFDKKIKKIKYLHNGAGLPSSLNV